MRRATRAFKIAAPAGHKNAPRGGKFGQTPRCAEISFLFCPDGSAPSLRQTATRRCRPAPARASSTGRSGAEHWLIGVGRGDRVIRIFGSLRGCPGCRDLPGYPAAPGDRGCPVVGRIGHIRGVGGVRRFRDGSAYLGGGVHIVDQLSPSGMRDETRKGLMAS